MFVQIIITISSDQKSFLSMYKTKNHKSPTDKYDNKSLVQKIFAFDVMGSPFENFHVDNMKSPKIHGMEYETWEF